MKPLRQHESRDRQHHCGLLSFRVLQIQHVLMPGSTPQTCACDCRGQGGAGQGTGRQLVTYTVGLSRENL